MGHVQMNSKLPCYLAIETMYSIKTSARNCQMSRAFDLLICGLWRWWLWDHQRNTKVSSDPHGQGQREDAFKTSQMAVGVGCHSGNSFFSRSHLNLWSLPGILSIFSTIVHHASEADMRLMAVGFRLWAVSLWQRTQIGPINPLSTVVNYNWL